VAIGYYTMTRSLSTGNVRMEDSESSNDPNNLFTTSVTKEARKNKRIKTRPAQANQDSWIPTIDLDNIINSAAHNL